MYKLEPMSTITVTERRSQNNPDSSRPSPGRAPTPEVQTRTSLAVTPEHATSSTEITLDHDDHFPSQATARRQQLQLILDSEHHHQLYHYVRTSTTDPLQRQHRA
jgi:hypothetical protein